MIEKKTFKKIIGDTLKRNGFYGKAQSWYLDGKDAVVVFNLQKSDYENKYYINFGIWLKRFGENIYPKENHCHIQSRLTSLFPDYASMIDAACLLETSSEEAMRLFVDFVNSRFIAFCHDCSTEDKLKNFIFSSSFENALVMKVVKDIFYANR